MDDTEFNKSLRPIKALDIESQLRSDTSDAAQRLYAFLIHVFKLDHNDEFPKLKAEIGMTWFDLYDLASNNPTDDMAMYFIELNNKWLESQDKLCQ